MHRLVFLAAALVVTACGDDDKSSTSSDGGSSSVGGSGGAGASGAGPTTGGGGTSAGPGGNGGSGAGPFVNPIQGIDPAVNIASGYNFTEGTAWFAAQNVLRFSDIPAEIIHEIDGTTETVTVWRSNSGRANGNGIDESGNMVTCEGGNRQVVRFTDPNNSDVFEVVADQYMGDRLNAPNDVIVRSDGIIYFTDPNYGLNPQDQDLAFQGVFYVDGTAVNLIDDTMEKPNGIALSPDESILYVTDAQTAELFSFDVMPDGSVTNKQKLADTNQSPDGFGVDDQGYLYLTTFAGIDVHRPDGTVHGNVPIPETPANCAFGGMDRRTLYITARTAIYRLTINVPGLP